MKLKCWAAMDLELEPERKIERGSEPPANREMVAADAQPCRGGPTSEAAEAGPERTPKGPCKSFP